MDRKHYSLSYEKDGVYITIHESAAADDPQSAVGVIRALERKQIASLDTKALLGCFLTPKVPVCIAPPQREALIDEGIDVTIDDDRMTAYVTFFAPDGGALFDAGGILQTLENFGVYYGVSEIMVNHLADNPGKTYDVPIAIATATPPIKGADAWIEYHFRLVRDRVPRMLPDGSVDHKDLDFIENVRAGALLATLHPESDGTPGVDVVGTEIPAQRGVAKRLPAGKSTVISEDEIHLTAETDGRVEMVSDKVTVMQLLEIKGDVDAGVGSITFLGDVSVRGNVLSQYSIEAAGSVDVGGVIEATRITAGGNVVVRQGIKGMGGCDIVAGGDVTAKFIENAKVRAGGTIRADVILHSTVSSRQSIIASGRKGIVNGGAVSATKDIVASTLGSAAMTYTICRVGITPEFRQEYDDTSHKIAAMQSDLDRSYMLYARLLELIRRGVASDLQKKQMTQLTPHLDQLEDQLYSMRESVRAIGELMAASKNGRVHIRGEIFPHVVITIGDETTKVMQRWKHATYHYVDGKGIELIPYNYSEQGEG